MESESMDMDVTPWSASPTVGSPPARPERTGVSGAVVALLVAGALLVGLASGLAIGTAGGYLVAKRQATREGPAQPNTLQGAQARPADVGSAAPQPGVQVLPLDPSNPDFDRLLEQLPPEIREQFREFAAPPTVEPDA